MNIIKRIETYIQDYVTLADPHYALPIALWTLGSFCFPSFDAYPYLVITAAVKRSGKTRLSEMISFACSNPRNFSALTAATMFRAIEMEKPTLIFDEAETLGSESASMMRAVLNVGYRRGQTIPRVTGKGIKEFATYCPKIFILIGDVYDTLRDRSIVITMQRAEPRKRFTFEAAKTEGQAIREECHSAIQSHQGDIEHGFSAHQGISFLMDRDEEIWTPLFVLAKIFCRDRMKELEMAAADMATEKTADSRRYVDLKGAEDAAMEDEYAKRLLLDLYALLTTNGKVISTQGAIDALRAIPTAPWRKFRGLGISAHDMANMLSRFGVRPVRIAVGSGRGNQKFYRGYRRQDVERAMQRM